MLLPDLELNLGFSSLRHKDYCIFWYFWLVVFYISLLNPTNFVSVSVLCYERYDEFIRHLTKLHC